ncbi:MAG: histidinol-phosphatase HisJ family protein [Clostridia bacterium]|nr:histidinol-phosphatase HisJ family protein [Clostridia bacterium]
MILCDMHTHSQSSHDSVARVEEMAMGAIKNGVGVIAITDHADVEYYIEHGVRALIDNSVREATLAARELSDRLKILTGIELGEGIWNKDYTSELLADHSYDVVIGSVHAVRCEGYSQPYSTIDFSKMELSTLNKYIKMYFEDVLTMIKTVPCDIMAHLTCPFRYINGKYGLGVDTRLYKPQIMEILRYIIDNSIAMEINTSGNDTMPEGWIIEEFKKMGGYIITLGSDAHIPKNVGKDFECTLQALKQMGFEGYYYFEKRQRIFVDYGKEAN